MSHDHLAETLLLDFRSASIRELVAHREWVQMTTTERVGAAYDFVRNEIRFGYNSDDATPASQVLSDGYGQCNTKGTLLMALLRALGIPCRLHGFTINKGLQRGIVPELVYPLAPKDIIHSWVEVEVEGSWIDLEGFILDQEILRALQVHFPDRVSLFGYGAGTDCLQAPKVEWVGESTYIQKTGITHDFGVFDSPDDFYADHRQLSGLRGVMYRHAIRHWMNRRVEHMRNGRVPEIPGGDANLRPSSSTLRTTETA